MARIFLSYRREDTGGYAGRLFDRLSTHFGRSSVFMDIDTIEPGLDFVQVIEEAVGSCDVLLALIGRQWLIVTDSLSQRRLDNPEDYVRLEISTALKRNIRVIPVIVQGTVPPRSVDLPDDLKLLSRRNALEVSDTHFHNDVDRLIEVLDRVIKTNPSPHQQNKKERPAETLSSANSQKVQKLRTIFNAISVTMLGILLVIIILLMTGRI
jgi:hypothetical protein